jgi:hypothetical protein
MSEITKLLNSLGRIDYVSCLASIECINFSKQKKKKEKRIKNKEKKVEPGPYGPIVSE